MSVLDDRLAALKNGDRFAPASGHSLGFVAMERTAEAPDHVVVLDAQRELTRAELLDQARRLGGALLARGLKPGAAIAFQLPNWWEACVVNLAAALFGFRLAPLLTIYRSAELRIMLPACAIE